MQKTLISISLLIITFGWSNLMINGDFEQPLTMAWLMDSSGVNIIIDRATNYDPDGNYEAQSYKGVGSGYASLYQMVDVPSVELTFSCNAKLYAFDNDADTLCWAGAAVVIGYHNSAGTRLGETRICQFTTPGTWTSSSTRHLINVFDSLWHNYSLNIANEISTYLPGVNPANVSKISVALFDTTAHTC